MGRFGTISFNIYCNFTNYGSALQTWALLTIIKRLGHSSVLVDYCPDILADKDPLNPFPNMWDQDEKSRKNCELTMPAIRENFIKFDRFYHEVCPITKNKYTSANFNQVIEQEKIDGFICGSDTIFCIDEFKGFDDGYFANYACMKKRSVSYAASFGDAHFDETTYPILNERLQNFKAVGIRENSMLQYVTSHTNVPCQRTIDPTLLLKANDYDALSSARQVKEPYLLFYTRRYDTAMEAYAEKVAKEKGLKIVEISLRATNADKGHIMRYDAGVEEFLSLMKHADFVVTNSFHGLIFGVQYKKPLVVFIREQAGNKINELLDLFGMQSSKFITGHEQYKDIDYDKVHLNIEKARKNSLDFLKMELECL